MSRALIIGLTGPTGAGKSTLSRAFAACGFAVIDADKVARECTSAGSPLLPILESEFGNILQIDGSLSREALAKEAFSSKEKTERLNAIMLPFIVKKIEDKIEALEAAGEKKILLDAPTLFEAGADRLCSAVVALLSDREKRLERILSRDSISSKAAEMRIAAGKADEFYKERCRYIIYNNEGEAELLEKSKELIERLRSEVEK